MKRLGSDLLLYEAECLFCDKNLWLLESIVDIPTNISDCETEKKLYTLSIFSQRNNVRLIHVFTYIYIQATPTCRYTATTSIPITAHI